MFPLSRSSRTALALYVAVSWLDVGYAQTPLVSGSSGGFMWKFNNTFASDFPQCSQQTISIISENASAPNPFGTPPYYLIAWKPSGIPTTSPIGTDPYNLTWTVNQASGSSLLLTVADSLGLSGGETGVFFTVSDGDSSCLPSAPNNNNLRLASNVSTTAKLQTCQQLGLRVYGGTQPYNVSLAAINSPVVTNITLGANEDVVTWINRADPNGQLIASVSDANGWGTSTGILHTAGGTNITCTGLITRTGNHNNVDQNPPPPSKSHAAVIAGVVVPIVALLILGAAGFWWWRRRRAARLEPEPAFMPDAWIGPAHHPGAELGYVSSDSGVADQEYSPYGPAAGPNRDSKLARYRDDVAFSRRTMSGGSVSGVGMALLAPGGSSAGPSTPRWSGHERGVEGPGSSDIVIQHRDAGGVGVTEVPPPYLDHRSSVADSSDVGAALSGAGSSAADASSFSGPSQSGPSHTNAPGGGFYLNVAGPSRPAGSSSYAHSSNEKSEKSLLA